MFSHIKYIRTLLILRIYDCSISLTDKAIIIILIYTQVYRTYLKLRQAQNAHVDWQDKWSPLSIGRLMIYLFHILNMLN